MDLLTVRLRAQDVLQSMNRGKSYISSSQLRQFLDLVEAKFGILVGDKLWDTVKLFTSRYPDLCVEKSIFLEFLNDLLQLDFVEYLATKIDTKTVDITSSLGSPLNLTNKSLEPEYAKLSTYIDESIKNLPNRQSPTGKRENIVRISIWGSLCSFMARWPTILTYLNSVLLILLIWLLAVQNIDLQRHVAPILEKLFLGGTTSDLYWWQRWRVSEKLVWTLLEWARND